MAKKSTTTATDFQSFFDPKGYQDTFKTFASFNERMTSIAIEAATKSTDIATETAQETFANVRDVTVVRSEPADYARAYGDFFQKQADLFMRTAKSFGEVSQKAGTETSDLASEAGEELGQTFGSQVSEMTEKANAAAKKAAA